MDSVWLFSVNGVERLLDVFFCVKQDRAVVKWCRDALVKYASLQTL